MEISAVDIIFLLTSILILLIHYRNDLHEICSIKEKLYELEQKDNEKNSNI